jgi:hypothetical protein
MSDDYFGLQPMSHNDHIFQKTRSIGYAEGSAPVGPPPGTIFIPELNTHVDSDVAESLGFSRGGAQASQVAPGALDALQMPQREPEPVEEQEELSDEDLEALQNEIEELADREPSLSPTLDEIAQCFGNDFEDAVSGMVVGSNEDTLEALSKATGLDQQTASILIETAVNEAAPHAVEMIGPDCWNSILYAATSTPDPHARRIVADMVSGKLHPAKLAKAYSLWWNSLPDDDGEA